MSASHSILEITIKSIYYNILLIKQKREQIRSLFSLYIIGRYQNYTDIFCKNPFLRSFICFNCFLFSRNFVNLTENKNKLK